MSPSTEVYRYTLLIVESPTIARRISACQLPWLEVLSTGGYCWFPKWDSKKHIYRFRANPEQRELRKELKEKAKWASRIIIATDSDPSGQFISASVSHFLKDADCRRAYLNDLSKTGILAMISSADLPNAIDDIRTLTEQKIKQDKLREKYGDSIFPPFMIGPKLVLDEMNAGKGEFLRHTSGEQKFLNLHNTFVPDFSIPPHTMDMLHCPAFPENMPFSKRQKTLNELFTFQHDALPDGLISYPRTGVIGFYWQSWQTLQQQFAQISGADVLPELLRFTAEDAEPHESIRVISLKQTPEHTRPYLPGLLQKLYTHIYNHTLACLTQPEWFSDFSNLSVPEQTQTRPHISSTEFGKRLHFEKVISPSAFGKLLDKCATMLSIKMTH